MTFLDAAYEVLLAAGKPLHYEEIARIALAQSLITTNGATPEATMGSRLYTDTTQVGSRFVRTGKGVFDLAPREPGGIDARVEQINQTTRDRLRDLLAQTPPKKFESLVLELLLAMGFDEKTVEVTPYSKDGGIDVKGVYAAAGLVAVNAAVQVKRWKSNVQAPKVTELRGSLQVHQAGIMITTSDFSTGARAEAAAPGKSRIALINGDELISLLIKHHVGVVDKQLTVTQLDEEWWGELQQAAVKVGTSAAPAAPVAPEAPQPVPVPTPSVAPKPSIIVLWGATLPVKTWKGVLVAVIEGLAQRHPETFAEVALQVRGTKRHYVSRSSANMYAPVPIGDTGLWLEANQSAATVRDLCERFLIAFGYVAVDLEIVLAAAPHA